MFPLITSPLASTLTILLILQKTPPFMKDILVNVISDKKSTDINLHKLKGTYLSIEIVVSCFWTFFKA